MTRPRRRRGMGGMILLLVMGAMLWIVLSETGIVGGWSAEQEKVFRILGKKGRPTLVVFGAPT